MLEIAFKVKNKGKENFFKKIEVVSMKDFFMIILNKELDMKKRKIFSIGVLTKKTKNKEKVQ